MEFDDLQKAWQEQQAPHEGLYDEERVQEMVKKVKGIDRALFWRDLLETATALIGGAACIIGANTVAVYAWPWYVAAAIDFGVAFFFIMDRRIQRDDLPDPSVRNGLERALRRVEHQVSLLRNVATWYVIPFAVSGLLIFGDLWIKFTVGFGPWKYAWLTLMLILGCGLNILVYRLNQREVNLKLLPLKEELEGALKELDAPA